MDDLSKKIMVGMFGQAVPMMDLDTCAKVLYKPSKDSKDIAWLPIGWETHQPAIFVQAQDPEDSLLVGPTGEREIIITGRMYVNIDFLSTGLWAAIREELGLTKRSKCE